MRKGTTAEALIHVYWIGPLS